MADALVVSWWTCAFVLVAWLVFVAPWARPFLARRRRLPWPAWVAASAVYAALVYFLLAGWWLGAKPIRPLLIVVAITCAAYALATRPRPFAALAERPAWRRLVGAVPIALAVVWVGVVPRVAPRFYYPFAGPWFRASREYAVLRTVTVGMSVRTIERELPGFLPRSALAGRGSATGFNSGVEYALCYDSARVTYVAVERVASHDGTMTLETPPMCR